MPSEAKFLVEKCAFRPSALTRCSFADQSGFGDAKGNSCVWLCVPLRGGGPLVLDDIPMPWFFCWKVPHVRAWQVMYADEGANADTHGGIADRTLTLSTHSTEEMFLANTNHSRRLVACYCIGVFDLEQRGKLQMVAHDALKRTEAVVVDSSYWVREVFEGIARKGWATRELLKDIRRAAQDQNYRESKELRSAETVYRLSG